MCYTTSEVSFLFHSDLATLTAPLLCPTLASRPTLQVVVLLLIPYARYYISTLHPNPHFPPFCTSSLSLLCANNFASPDAFFFFRLTPSPSALVPLAVVPGGAAGDALTAGGWTYVGGEGDVEGMYRSLGAVRGFARRVGSGSGIRVEEDVSIPIGSSSSGVTARGVVSKAGSGVSVPIDVGVTSPPTTVPD